MCIIWQKVQLDKPQLLSGLCSEEMNGIRGLINRRSVMKEATSEPAELCAGERSRESGADTAA